MPEPFWLQSIVFVVVSSRFLRVDCTGFYLVCTECTGMTRDSSDDRFSPEAGQTDRRKNLDGMYLNLESESESIRKWNDNANFIFFVRTSLFFLDSKRNVAPLEN